MCMFCLWDWNEKRFSMKKYFNIQKNSIIATIIIFFGMIIASWITEREDLLEKLYAAIGLSIGYFIFDSVDKKRKK